MLNFFLDYYRKVTDYKRYGIKVTIAIGGWNDSEGDKYSRLVNSPAARKKFIDHVLQFIEKYNFDGPDLDWEYPSCWQVLNQYQCTHISVPICFFRLNAKKKDMKIRHHLLHLFQS